MTLENPHPLDCVVWDAEARFLAAPPGFEIPRARRLVEAKFARGDFHMLQALDDATRDAMARALVDMRAAALAAPAPSPSPRP
jgi:hypothetical protein